MIANSLVNIAIIILLNVLIDESHCSEAAILVGWNW